MRNGMINVCSSRLLLNQIVDLKFHFRIKVLSQELLLYSMMMKRRYGD